MEYRILCQPSYSVLEVDLEPGESIVTEAGSMTWRDTSLKSRTRARGGLWRSFTRMLAGESFFQNIYRATKEKGTIGFAPGAPGDIRALELDGREVLMEKGAYLAATPEIEVQTKFGGIFGFLKEGMFILRCSGKGTLFFCSCGDITEIEVDGEYVIDNGYAVAWDPELKTQLVRSKQIGAALLSDQLMMKFNGHGRLWIQSRSPRAMARWAGAFRPNTGRGFSLWNPLSWLRIFG